ncbi:MAG: hypothetical protein WCF79_03520 [Rhodomicrobium sp.]
MGTLSFQAKRLLPLINARSGQQAAARLAFESRESCGSHPQSSGWLWRGTFTKTLVYHAMTEQPLSSKFDIAPMWKMYMEPIEAWRKNYETLLKSTPFRADGMDGKKAEVESITSSKDTAMLYWRRSGEEIFKRLVQNQMELCHFFGHRWEQYLKLPEQLTQCRSLTELGNLQSSFLSQFASDYLQEAGKLARQGGGGLPG